MRINNSAEYLPNESTEKTHWWRWTAFLDDVTEDELESIEYVEYHLHPSFKNPVKRSKSKKTNFSISAKGWGTFEITARVKYLDNRPDVTYVHALEF